MGRKLKKVGKEVNQDESCDAADALSVNDNCQGTTVSRKRNVNKANMDDINLKSKKGRRVVQTQENAKEDSTSEIINVEKIQYEDEQDQVEFEVDDARDDFLSDGKVDSEEEYNGSEANQSTLNKSDATEEATDSSDNADNDTDEA